MCHKEVPPLTSEQERMEAFYRSFANKRGTVIDWARDEEGGYLGAHAGDAWAAWQCAAQSSSTKQMIETAVQPSQQSEIEAAAVRIASRIAKLGNQTGPEIGPAAVLVAQDDWVAISGDEVAETAKPLPVFTEAAFGLSNSLGSVAGASLLSPTPMQVAANTFSFAQAMRLVVKHQLDIEWLDNGMCTVTSRACGHGRARFSLPAAVREAVTAMELSRAQSKESETG
ncbi:MAG: hypothetical protein JWR16_880 [Nevskia sp.]|nr:hypothetical protein [Nevskia sp.]